MDVCWLLNVYKQVLYVCLVKNWLLLIGDAWSQDLLTRLLKDWQWLDSRLQATKQAYTRLVQHAGPYRLHAD